MNELNKIVRSIYSLYKEFVIFETLKVDDENYLSYIFYHPKDKLVLESPKEIKNFFYCLEEFLKKGYYLAGFFSYELGYFLDYYGEKYENLNFPLAFFYAFKEPIIFNHKTCKFEKNSSFSKEIVTRNNISRKFKIKNFHLNVEYDEYERSIEKIKSYILNGDTYQVNYTIKAKFDFSGSTLGFYERLKQTQKVSYAAFIKTNDFTIISLSPELFLRKTSDLITVKPMKGTCRRGNTLDEDETLAKKLHTDIKNRAENVMIVDLLRNDLGKISSYGNVKVKKLFEVEKYETLFQMTSTIEAKINKNISLYKLFYSLFPSGSVTGAPKIRTMQIIKEVEKEPRNVYTGAIGFFTPQKDAVFNVAIRTILIDKNKKAEMGIGSGIVYDSVAKDEFEECKLKSIFVLKTAPKFRLVETMLYCKNFNKVIDNFDGLKLKIDKEKFKYGFFLLDEHLKRLRNSAEYFGFKYDEEKIVKKLLSFNLNGCHKVRLLLSKDGKIEIKTSRFSCKNFCCKKIEKVALVEVDFNNNVFLYHKTTNRRLYNKYYQYFKTKKFFDVVFVNKDGLITEATRGNIFVKFNNTIYTPEVKIGLLDGVFRKYLIQHNKGLIKEDRIELEKLKEAEKIYYTNAVIGIREIKIQKINYDERKIS